jgi:hypothetical protein
MSEKDPKRLDQLFQHGSEQYDFEYNPEAWEQMESLLDKDKRRRRIIWWWGALFLLLATASVVWFLNQKEGEIPDQHSIENATEVAPQDNMKAKEEPLQPEEASIPVPAKTETGKKETPPLSEESEKGNSTEATETAPAAPAQTQADILEERLLQVTPPIAGQKQKHERKEQAAAKETTAADEALPNRMESGREPAGQDPAETYPELLPLPVLPFDQLAYPDDRLRLDDLPAVTPHEGQTNSKSDSPNFLLFALLAGGEVTVIDTPKTTGPDWKLGIRLEYFYQGRYSLSLGANYVRKSYLAGEGAYSPPKGFWTRNIVPQSTYGTCKVLEIPILIAYYPKGALRSGWFTRIGFTSYFMLQERYYYSYESQDTDLIRKWYGDNEYQHWFGIGHLSIGYHRKLGNKSSLQLAPYCQVPLTGLGHGNSKLWSIGINASFNFRMN